MASPTLAGNGRKNRVRCLLTDVGRVTLAFDANRGLEMFARLYDTTCEKMREVMIHSKEPEWLDFERGMIGPQEFIASCNRRFGRVAAAEAFAFAMNSMCIGPVEPVLALWRRLRQRGVLIASASNVNFFHHCHIDLNYPTVFEPLDVMGASCLLKVRKGDEGFFPLLIEQVSMMANGVGPIAPEECIFVDDIEANLDEARKHGIGTVLFDYEKRTVDELRDDLVAAGIPAESFAE